MAPKNSGEREYWKYAGLGFEFAALVGLFFYFGYLADKRWGTDPWGFMIGGAVGLIGGIYVLAKEGLKAMRGDDAPPGKSDDESRRSN